MHKVGIILLAITTTMTTVVPASFAARQRSTVGVPVGVADETYLKLDASNDPVTGDLALNEDLTLADDKTITLGATNIGTVTYEGTARKLEIKTTDVGGDSEISIDSDDNILLLPKSASTNSEVVIGAGVDGQDYRLRFDGNAADGILDWNEDEDEFEFADDVIMSGLQSITFGNTANIIIGADTAQRDLSLSASQDILLNPNARLLIGDGSADINYSVEFDGETSNGIVTWMEDEDYFQFADKLLFDDKISFTQTDENEYIDSEADGDLDLAATTTIDMSISTTERLAVDVDGIFVNGQVENSDKTKQIPFEHEKCSMIEALAAADDDFPLGSLDIAGTIQAVWCKCHGTCTTKAQMSLEDDDGNAMTHTTPTCADAGTEPTEQSVTAANALVAHEAYRFDVDNTPAPETDTYEICVAFSYDD